MDKKVLFLDIDGTLVKFDGTMPDSARRALLAAREKGHELVLCTGRSRLQIYPWLLEAVSFDGFICSSGTHVEADGKVIASHSFSREDYDIFSAYMKKEGIPFLCHVPGGSLCEAGDRERILALYLAAGVDEEALTKCGGNDLFVDDAHPRNNVEKFIYYGASKTQAQIQAEIGPRFNVVAFSFGEMGSACGEVSPGAYDKDTGIAEYLAYRGLPLEASIAVGDGPNDERMLRYAGTSVAMGNASPYIQSLADYVTDPIEADGFAHALVHLGLIEG